MKNVLESLRLKVKLPMVLEMDHQEAVYLANNWSIEGRTKCLIGVPTKAKGSRCIGDQVNIWYYQ
jgi:hypothetical protein